VVNLYWIFYMLSDIRVSFSEMYSFNALQQASG